MANAMNKAITALYDYVDRSALTIIEEKEIEYGRQFRLSNGTEICIVNIYTSGKIVMGGKQTDLRQTVQEWANFYIAGAEPTMPTPPSGDQLSHTAKYIVALAKVDTIKAWLAERFADRITVQDQGSETYQFYRAEVQDPHNKVTLTQYRTGTLVVQGRYSSLFEEVCTLLEERLSLSFAERVARYVPDEARDEALDYASTKEAENDALEWARHELGQAYDWLRPRVQEIFLSAVGVLLAITETGRQLHDFSVLVMPFAKAYEGCLIQLAMHLGLTSDEEIAHDTEKIKIGMWLDQIKEGLAPSQQYLITPLKDAWECCRHKTIHVDFAGRERYLTLQEAEREINVIVRAMTRAHSAFVTNPVPLKVGLTDRTKPARKQPHHDQREKFAGVNVEILRKACDTNGLPVTPGGSSNYWQINTEHLKVVCPRRAPNTVFIGGADAADFIHEYEALLRPGAEIPVELEQTASASRIGVDESGKGDYFGPLVIAGVYVDEVIESELIRRGVRDSKQLSDGVILNLAEEIKGLCRHSVVVIGPKRYNELHQELKNLNRLLAWGHARAIENLLGEVDCETAISDQFGDESFLQQALMKKGRRITLEQRPHAEEDVAVAAASILARAEFVRRLGRLGRRAGIKLPKGASGAVIQAGKELVQHSGPQVLSEVAKIHFKTTQSIMAS